MCEQEAASSTSNPHRGEVEKRMCDMASFALTELLREKKLCDVVIKVGDAEFDAHKIILCSCSPYFRALFTGAWAISKKKSYNIPGVSPAMMRLIIDYAYTHSVHLTEDNVLEVLAAADQFLVSGIVQTCCFFLEDQLCLKNCIGIWRLMHFYHLPELRRKVYRFILLRFEEIVCVSQEILELTVQQLAAIIENDHLNVRREEAVFETVLRWVKHLPDQRQGQISQLLSKVRLGLMTAHYLHNEVMNNDLIKDNIECIPIINAGVAKYMDFHQKKSSKSVYGNLLSRPRLPSSILLITGGKNDTNATTRLEAYDARADCWVGVSSGEICRTHHGTAALNGSVYLIGGSSYDSNLDTVQKFDLATCTWHQVAPMNSRRCYVSVAVQNGCIYAMGGFSGQSYYNTVECYKPETDRWTMMAPMRSKRCSAGAATLNDKVYICGGFNGNRSLSTAECYNPDTNQWTAVAPMRSYRSGLGVAAYKDRIYAMGGSNSGSNHMRSVEAYNPRSNTWISVPSMSKPRSYFGVEVVDGQLMVVGGYQGTTSLLAAERYDEEIGLWSRASDIEVPLSGLSCCVLHAVHNVVENLFPRGPLKSPTVEETEGDKDAEEGSI